MLEDYIYISIELNLKNGSTLRFVNATDFMFLYDELVIYSNDKLICSSYFSQDIDNLKVTFY